MTNAWNDYRDEYRDARDHAPAWVNDREVPDLDPAEGEFDEEGHPVESRPLFERTLDPETEKAVQNDPWYDPRYRNQTEAEGPF